MRLFLFPVTVVRAVLDFVRCIRDTLKWDTMSTYVHMNVLYVCMYVCFPPAAQDCEEARIHIPASGRDVK